MPNSAPATASFLSSEEGVMPMTKVKREEDLFPPVIKVDPMLAKYFEPEKVSIYDLNFIYINAKFACKWNYLCS